MFGGIKTRRESAEETLITLNGVGGNPGGARKPSKQHNRRNYARRTKAAHDALSTGKV